MLLALLPDGWLPWWILMDGCHGARLLPPEFQTLAFICIHSAPVQSRQPNDGFSLQTHRSLEVCGDTACAHTCTCLSSVCWTHICLNWTPTKHFSCFYLPVSFHPGLCLCLGRKSSRCVQVPAASWPRPPAACLSPLAFSFHYDAEHQYLEKAEDPISASAHRK